MQNRIIDVMIYRILCVSMESISTRLIVAYFFETITLFCFHNPFFNKLFRERLAVRRKFLLAYVPSIDIGHNNTYPSSEILRYMTI